MNPNPEDYGGMDMRKFFLEQFEYMLDTQEYELIDQRLIFSISGAPLLTLQKATNLDGIRMPQNKRKRKKRRRK